MITKDDITAMEIANIWAKRSHAKRLKVGCVIAKDGRIIGSGYNGTPSGQDTSCEQIEACPDCIYNNQLKICKRCNNTRLVFMTKPEVLHAEQNALMYMVRNGISTLGATLYVTHSPCITCAKLITQAGIKRVVYEKDYRNINGIKLLQKLDIIVNKI